MVERCMSSAKTVAVGARSEEHTSELQSQSNLVCRLLLEKKNKALRISTAGHRTGLVSQDTAGICGRGAGRTRHHVHAQVLLTASPAPRSSFVCAAVRPGH